MNTRKENRDSRRPEGVEDDRRKALEEEAANEPEHPSRWGGVRGWLSRGRDDEEAPDEADDERLIPRKPRKPGRVLAEGGRPKPSVRRGDSHRHAKRSNRSRHRPDDDEEL